MGSFQAGVGVFTTLIQVNVILVGCVLIANQMINLSDLVTFLLYIGVFTEPIKTLVDFTEQFQNGYSGFERFQEIMNICPDIEDASDAEELTDVKGDISFDNVSFHYQDNAEKVVQDSLEKLAKNRTTIVIAHRLTTIQNAENILVLTEDGITEQGTHEELLKQGGIYEKLYHMHR